MALFGLFGGRDKGPKSVSAFVERGKTGTPVIGGKVYNTEKSTNLNGAKRYITATDMLTNISIVAAGVRYFLDLCAKPKWGFEPADKSDAAKKYADLVEEMVTGMDTAWTRVIRRAGMYRFHGFGIHEWVARKADDGSIVLSDVKPRPQHTVARWVTDDFGTLEGIWQRPPMNHEEIWIPRTKMLYLVDDMLTDSPEGSGWFRALAEPMNRIKSLQELETLGYDRNLAGIPLGRVPYGELDRMVLSGEITEAQKASYLSEFEDFVELTRKTEATSLILDSEPYVSQGDGGESFTQMAKWSLDLIKGDMTGMEHIGTSIERLTYEMAMVIGVESMLVGKGGGGSLALAKSKSENLYLVCNSALADMAEAVDRDLISMIFKLNDWPDEMKPVSKPEDVSFKDIDQISGMLRNMATAGATLAPDDPAINDLRDLAGISKADMEKAGEMAEIAMDEAVRGNQGGDDPKSGNSGGEDDDDSPDPNGKGGDDSKNPKAPDAKKYDPNQPRDEDGKWTDAGAGAVGLSDEIEINGEMRPTEDSNGRRLGETEEEIRNFYEWFGDSDVVDEHGRPLVVFHGSKHDFDNFRAAYGDGLMFFTTDPEFASKWPVGTGGLRGPTPDIAEIVEEARLFQRQIGNELITDGVVDAIGTPEGDEAYDNIRAEIRTRMRERYGYDSVARIESEAGVRVYPAYLSSQRLFNPPTDYAIVEPFLRDMPSMGGIIRSGYHRAGNWLVYENSEVTTFLREQGFDGIRLQESSGGGLDTIGVFRPNQIKSINNRGTWNPDDPDITKYDPNQPRDPAGSSTGGQWTAAGASGDPDVIFEVAPNPDDKELTERWNSLTDEQRLAITEEISEDASEDIFEHLGIEQAQLENTIGGFEGQVNPAIAAQVPSNHFEAAALLGEALSQKSMVVMSSTPMAGLDELGMAAVNIGDSNITQLQSVANQVSDIADGWTYRNGRMEFLNFTGMSNREFANAIDERLGGSYLVNHASVYSALMEAPSYASQGNFSTRNARRRFIGDVRRNVSRSLEEALQGFGKKSEERHSEKVLKYDPNQRRDPAGSETGGQWTSSSGTSSNNWTRDREMVGQAAGELTDEALARSEADDANFLSPQLTDDERWALAEYSGSGYRNINETLRTGRFEWLNDEQVDIVDNMDRAFDNQRTMEPFIAYRGLNLGAVDTDLDSIVPLDSLIQDSGFTSATMSPEVGADFADYAAGGDTPVVLRMNVRPNTRALYMNPSRSTRAAEREVLFPRNLRMVTTSEMYYREYPGDRKHLTIDVDLLEG